MIENLKHSHNTLCQPFDKPFFETKSLIINNTARLVTHDCDLTPDDDKRPLLSKQNSNYNSKSVTCT